MTDGGFWSPIPIRTDEGGICHTHGASCIAWTSRYLDVDEYVFRSNGSLVSRFEGLKIWYFWSEVVIVGCHCPPWYTDEFATTTYSNIIVYRVETIACLINTCRFYLVWRYVREFMFLGLKTRHTIQNFSHSPFTLANFSFVNLAFIFRCSSSTTNPVCERRVNLLVCSLPLHRHSYIGFI
jgi:hypothetical protein